MCGFVGFCPAKPMLTWLSCQHWPSVMVAKKQLEIDDLCSRFSDLVLAGKAELAYLGLVELAHDGPRGAGCRRQNWHSCSMWNWPHRVRAGVLKNGIWSRFFFSLFWLSRLSSDLCSTTPLAAVSRNNASRQILPTSLRFTDDELPAAMILRLSKNRSLSPF